MMTSKQSAGILLFRENKAGLEVFLVHPGGPFWKNKDEGVWSIPKGELNEHEESLPAAIREFFEETGVLLSGEFIPLNPVRLKSGKKVFAWALEKDIDAENILSNNFEIEWPPKSGKMQSFPEVDRGEWFTVAQAKKKINDMQVAFINELENKIFG
jgi:predicted NUDIX family NTP pyrophosphohydrolase